MNRILAAALAVSVALVAACGGDANTPSGAADDAAPPTAGTLGEQDVRPVSDYLAEPIYADADRDNGERLAQMCRTCHTFGAGGIHMIGPNLHGFFGRPAGSAERYAYSPALREAEFVWTPAALDAWLAQPARFLPGNRMSFPGVQRAGDRADLIAYLLAATAGGQDAG